MTAPHKITWKDRDMGEKFSLCMLFLLMVASFLFFAIVTVKAFNETGFGADFLALLSAAFMSGVFVVEMFRKWSQRHG